MAHVRTVSVGRPKDEPWAGNLRRTAIDKRPAPGPVRIGRLGLSGDQVADTLHHGGEEKAVYVFAGEDLEVWSERLNAEIRDGYFGENLTTVGLDVNAALIGERWRVGGALLEISTVRIPCNVFKNWMGRGGYDSSAWVRRFTQDGRPGPYLKVLEEGVVGAGDQIVVEHRPEHRISVTELFRILTTERHRLPELLEIDSLTESLRRKVEEKLGRTN